MTQFEPPPFRHHPLLVNGHLQTISSVRVVAQSDLHAVQHRVRLPDGDAIVLHEDRPPSWSSGDPTMLLVHGLVGCHAAPYMIRLMLRFYRLGWRVFRMDQRGCGAGTELAEKISHAGRSDDVIAALDYVAEQSPVGGLGAVAVSLGGNLLLRALGRVGSGADAAPAWLERLERVAVVAPPVDLSRCADVMDRWWMRPYNRYFIRLLLARAPERVRRLEQFRAAMQPPLPKTLREFDDRITAPLNGFESSRDYYQQSSSADLLAHNGVPSLILAAEDDPIVPVSSFTDRAGQLPASTRLVVTRRGGHVGFIDRSRRSWMDEAVMSWFQASIPR